MKQPTLLRSAVAAAVVGVCLTGGGVALAASDEPSTTSPSTSQQADKAPGSGKFGHRFRGGPGGPGGFKHRPGARFDVKDMAKALGVSEDTFKTALKKVMQENRPSMPRPDAKPGAKSKLKHMKPPTAAERKAMKDKFVSALAKELHKSTADVNKALATVKQDRKAERRDALKGRLDNAVKDHELTGSDEKSVLKAFDAGVLRPGRR